jgi:hypothetical protein
MLHSGFGNWVFAGRGISRKLKVRKQFEGLHVADGHISHVSITGGSVAVVIVDWREQEFIVQFSGVLGASAVCLGSQDLSHTLQTHGSEFSRSCCISCDEDPNSYWSFQFIEVSPERPILEIVAQNFVILERT